MFIAIAVCRKSPDRYQKDFDACFAYLSQYVEKNRPMTGIKVVSVAQPRPAKWQCTETNGTFKGKVELHKYSKDEYPSMSSAQSV